MEVGLSYRKTVLSRRTSVVTLLFYGSTISGKVNVQISFFGESRHCCTTIVSIGGLKKGGYFLTEFVDKGGFMMTLNFE